MKYLLSIILICLFINPSYSQQLEGEWKGSFKDRNEAISIPWVPINLKFTLNPDSSYTVHSFTIFNYLQKGKQYYDTTICLVYINKLTTDSIYLEEWKKLKPVDKDPPCFQKMALNIMTVRDKFLLTGTWESFSSGCTGSGTISFTRKKED